MTKHTPSHQSVRSATNVRGRRTVLAAGATAAVGALGAAGAMLAKPANAAAGGNFLLGRSNSAGTAATTLTSTTTSSVLIVKASKGHGVRVDETAADSWGIITRNIATKEGKAGAIDARGGKNIGLKASTSSATLPAALLVAPTGGVGSYVVGDAITQGVAAADAVLTAVYDTTQPANDNIGYAMAISGHGAYHQLIGTVPLTAAGTATVTFPKAFTDATTAAKAVVVVTAAGVASPGLFVESVSGTAVKLAGGSASGVVHYTITAPRRDLTGAQAVVAAAATKSSASKASIARKLR